MADAGAAKVQPPLIPLPRELSWKGASSEIKAVSLTLPRDAFDAAQYAYFGQEAKSLFAACGVASVPQTEKAYALRFVLSRDAWFSDKPEGYRLRSRNDAAIVEAATAKGFFYGLQTLAQLTTKQGDAAHIAHAEIQDWPAFPIRGTMNDTGRNYMPLSMLKEMADVLARYKMNVYHWHFTDNHGWRLESKIHPQVNDPASFDRMPGKFYTQAEFKEFVEYCRVRHITVIPELDMPGHTASFRRALKVEKMDDPQVTGILCDLIRELASLATPEVMPYIHIGTDEARGHEQVSAATLRTYFTTIHACQRRTIRWSPGMNGDPTAIQQTWTNRKRPPVKGGEYIDSQENYLNHFDPFEMVATLFFRKNCPHTSSKGLGGILCSWPDMPMTDPRNHFAQTAHFPGIVVYSEALWSDKREKDWIEFYSNLPPRGHEQWKVFHEFENRFLAHRDRFFAGKEFPYVKQSHIVWQTLGPFPHGGKPERDFGIQPGDQRASIDFEGKTYTWSEEVRTGATMVFRHYTDQPTFANPTWGRQTVAESTYYARTFIHSDRDQQVPFWISAQWWELSNFHGGMNPPGEWHYSKPVFLVNGVKIEAPKWAVPNRKPNYHSKESFIDENYHFRPPTLISLRAGWNEVLIKSPHVKGMRRWMFTFVPVKHEPGTSTAIVREFPGLRFAVKPE
jgi:hexosaminidase